MRGAAFSYLSMHSLTEKQQTFSRNFTTTMVKTKYLLELGPFKEIFTSTLVLSKNL